MKRYQLINNVLGWATFLIAAVVYCMTIEPTASFWDCPEFITTGYRLEVGHPPGAPFFMLTANLFSQFASDPTQVAKMVNTMSALLSATTILFLFWTITHLTRKLVLKSWEDLTPAKTVAIMGSGLVGALIYTFSDTFWFSAVEGEVYAYSSAFTAVVFWLILKWEDHADEPHSDRWLVLIMYMTGLSIGVHLLNLLCIPAIVLVYCYRRFPNIELKGSLLALIISFVLVAAVLYGVVPGIITVGGWFELFFVNTLGLPFNTGLIIYIILLVASMCWAIWETYHDNGKFRDSDRPAKVGGLIGLMLFNGKRQNTAFIIAFALLGVPFYGYGWSAFFIGVIVLFIIFCILHAKRRDANKKIVPLISARLKNTVLLCMLMLMIGYSSYALIVIRSSANPPMDQNSPEDIFTLGSYLSRDQYGYRPLLYGQAYTSPLAIKETNKGMMYDYSDGAPVYNRKEKETATEKDKYVVVDHKTEYHYASNMFFPRMYDSSKAASYASWMGWEERNENGQIDPTIIPGNNPKVVNLDGKKDSEYRELVYMPTFFQNMRFFLSYQCNFMYWRYFMWNFCGRQNDIQGSGEREHGNWITGISSFDNAMLGDQSLLPDDLKENKGHNVYYALPLLLGLIGLFWQAYRGKRGIRQFWVVFFLFFMTGLAIVIYLNQTPNQPRERDYAYAGSFYAYAIWCGIGVAAIIDLLKKAFAKQKVNELAIAGACAVACLFVPIQMASQNWDDHDRSGRYTCRDFGQNYLQTLQDKGNPIIFTNGDNDTFPLWYAQDVEGVRTDTRVCNLSYLQTDWYIDQMRRDAYNSPKLPISWERLQYCSGTNESVSIDTDRKAEILEAFAENPEKAAKKYGNEPFELKNVIKNWVLNPKTRCIPTDTLYMTIDKDAVKKSGMLMAADSIPDKMVISLKNRSRVTKSDLMMLEMISNANWTRPIYVATTVGAENFMNLGDNFIKEGLANRITPFTTNAAGVKNFDTEKAYKNVMERYRYGGMSTPGVYIDETVMRMCITHRRLLAELARNLIAENKKDKALKVLEKCDKELPSYNIPYDFISGGGDIAECYMLVGKKQRALEVTNEVWKRASQYLTYYLSQDSNYFAICHEDAWHQILIMNEIIKTYEMIDTNLAKQHEEELNKLAGVYQSRGGRLPDSFNN